MEDPKKAASIYKDLSTVLGFQPTDAREITRMAFCQLESFQSCMGPSWETSTTIKLPPHVDFSYHNIKALMVEIEIALFRWSLSAPATATNKKLYVDISKPSPQVLCKIPGGLSGDDLLPLAGKVTLTPTASSLPLCVPWFKLCFVINLQDGTIGTMTMTIGDTDDTNSSMAYGPETLVDL